MNRNYAFSPANKTFYSYQWRDEFANSGTWPEDAVDVTDETFLEYSANPPQGMALGAGDNSLPQWVPVPPPTDDELIELAEQQKASLRAVADIEISWRKDAVDAGIATTEEAAALTEWKKYRVLLMRVNTARPEWPTPPASAEG
ncbi:tail fiber assembly protein [Enterobacter asburiae]|nr:tail fiber assembly protein [Escherichia coli]